MRVDIGRSRYVRVCAAGVLSLGAAAWAQIAWVRGSDVGDWLAGLPARPGVLRAPVSPGPLEGMRVVGWPGMLAAFVLLMLALVFVARRVGAGRRRTTRLVLLGHADARVYWQTDSRRRCRNVRRKRPSGGSKNDHPTAGIDDVCIVEMVQWGGVCLWLALAPRYPEATASRRAWPTAWFAGKRRASRRWLCIPADAVTPERFHALCARCQAMRRGAGFLSPW